MKTKSLRSFTLIILILRFSTLLDVSLAQTPPPAGGSGHVDHGQNQAPGGGASLYGGVGISLLLIAGYGGYILYRIRKKQNQINVTSE
jgi:hypothetical protein